MLMLLRLFLGRPDTGPFVSAYLETGDYTPLLAMCDLVEETGAGDLVVAAREIRVSLTN